MLTTPVAGCGTRLKKIIGPCWICNSVIELKNWNANCDYKNGRRRFAFLTGVSIVVVVVGVGCLPLPGDVGLSSVSHISHPSCRSWPALPNPPAGQGATPLQCDRKKTAMMKIVGQGRRKICLERCRTKKEWLFDRYTFVWRIWRSKSHSHAILNPLEPWSTRF